MGDAAGRWGVLLINTGSPAAPEPAAVKRYLAEFLMDGNVRPLPAVPWWVILHAFILPRRKVASAEKYRAIWTEDGSPLVAHMGRLAAGVEAALAARADCAGDPAGPCPGAGASGRVAPHPEVTVRMAMAYGEPSARTALEDVRAQGCARILAVPLYPQSARCTTGAALAAVGCALKEMRWQPELHAVERYADERRYTAALAASVRCAGFDPARDHLLFSFHSAPMSDVRAGDTYPEQVGRTARHVADRLGCDKGGWSVSYQSPFEDRRTWLAPFTADRLAELGQEGCRSLYLVCPGFSCDCLETLWDVERELKPAFLRAARAAGAPEPSLTYVPCLNETPDHIDLLAHVIRKTLTVNP